ncbi:hypothetical protein, partial [Mesorhizobium sp. M7A.F.Ca.CA.001.08.2.1]|uniref:hypothetical protein n=2 Tax=Mesorhizobium TaxID=68287 RepID=UPI0019D264AC
VNLSGPSDDRHCALRIGRTGLSGGFSRQVDPIRIASAWEMRTVAGLTSWPVKCHVGIFGHLELKPDLQKLESLDGEDCANQIEARAIAR